LHSALYCDKLFTMLNNKDTILQCLRSLNLSADESKLYLELLKGAASHLELSRATGINRTKVYRLADELEKRSLITTRTDDRGTFLIAADPTTLEVELVTQEEKLKSQRTVFEQLLPTLASIKKLGELSPTNFVVHTYEGIEGFKQMLWHELKTKDEVVIFGSGRLEDLVLSSRWAEKHRVMTLKADYQIRELLNPGKKQEIFTKNPDYMTSYHRRLLPEDILVMEHQVAIYNDTVATYCWRHDQKVGFEVVNGPYAHMMRQVFEQYWQIAEKTPIKQAE
jgi:sugar-specific transcriptional regulator TrmB